MSKNLNLPGRGDGSISFFWNGRKLSAGQGDTVAVALLASGIRTLAKTRKSHRPLGYSGFYTNGVLARVNGVPNVRLDTTLVMPEMRVEMQNCWPSAKFDLFRLARLIPPTWIQGGFEHINLVPSGNALFQRWEKFLAFMAGVAKPADVGVSIAPKGERVTSDLLIVGGGTEGARLANEAAQQGKSVVLVSRSDVVGRFAKAMGQDVPALHPHVLWLPGVDVFGSYREGSVLLGAPVDPSRAAVVLEAGEVVLATGRKTIPPLLAGAWLPGVMDAKTAVQMASEHHVAAGTAVAVFGAGEQDRVASRLIDLGVKVVKVGALSEVRKVNGYSKVEGVLCEGGDVSCDAVVIAGHGARDESLAFQSSSEGLRQLASAPTRYRLYGTAALADDPVWYSRSNDKETLLCPCFDVSAEEVRQLLKQGINDLEVIKRLTSCGMGPCQGNPCWQSLRAFVAMELGVPMFEVAKPTLRPPRRAITVAQAAGLADVVEPLK